jgi:hypothetical protein
MRKLVVLAIVLGLAPAAFASQIVISNSEAVPFTAVDSVNAIGDPANVMLTSTLVGGFVANNVVVTGTLTEVLTATYASEADIAITAPGGSVAANGATTSSYVGTIAVGPTATAIATPFDPAGLVSFEFYESFDDGPGTDQIWDDITIEFQNVTVQNGMFDLGMLPSDGSVVSATGTNVNGGLDFYDFSIGASGVVGGGDYLNIQTRDALTGDTIDSEIALFDSAGILVAYDDDGQESAFGGLYSMLSFGAGDPLTPASPVGSDALPGEDGLTLAAGAYTLVLGGYDSNFEDLTIGTSTINEVTPGTSDGDYEIRFSYVPEPMTASLLALGGLALLRRRR